VRFLLLKMLRRLLGLTVELVCEDWRIIEDIAHIRDFGISILPQICVCSVERLLHILKKGVMQFARADGGGKSGSARLQIVDWPLSKCSLSIWFSALSLRSRGVTHVENCKVQSINLAFGIFIGRSRFLSFSRHKFFCSNRLIEERYQLASGTHPTRLTDEPFPGDEDRRKLLSHIWVSYICGN